MSLELILLKPSGEEFGRLNMECLRSSTLAMELLHPGLLGSVVDKLTPTELGNYSTLFERFLTGYRLDHPPFPRAALLQFTELGPYWAQLVIEAENLYENDSVEFEAAIDEIVATIQIDMEEEHQIPYNKHRYYDTVLCFKAEYDGALWRRGPRDPVFTLCDFDYLAYRRDELQKAAAAGCLAEWRVSS